MELETKVSKQAVDQDHNHEWLLGHGWIDTGDTVYPWRDPICRESRYTEADAIDLQTKRDWRVFKDERSSLGGDPQ